MLDFLRHNEADTIYLVGDIIDGWRLRAGWYWPQAHNDVVQKLLRKVRRGARMVFVPGNHDEFARQFFGLIFGGIEITRNAIHIAADGKRYLVMHGDEFDVVVRHSKWLAYPRRLGLRLRAVRQHPFQRVRRLFGFDYWSLSAWAKLKVKNAVNFIGSFEQRLAGEAKRRGADGVICGHIHHPVIKQIEGVDLCQHRRFRRILLAHRRAPRRQARSDVLVDALRSARAGESRRRTRRRRDSRPKPKPRDEHSRRDRRLEAASQRRRPYSRAHDGGGAGIRRRLRLPHASGLFHRCRCRPIPTSASRSRLPGRLRARSKKPAADHIHIATEGPIGWAARSYCLKRGRLFTTSYHTRFPEYIYARTGLPEDWTYAALTTFSRARRGG